MKTLFLAWRDPRSRSWFPVGRLMLRDHTYEFVYTRGAQDAARFGFQPLPMFPDLTSVYESQELFPLFQNRAPSPHREDYFEFVQWLNLPQSEHDPLAVLARSEGRRATDAFEVFPCPQPESDGSYRLHFFVHGITYLSPQSLERIHSLRPGEQLLVMWDIQNPYDQNALALRSNDTFPGDRCLVGYCPRYFTKDWLSVLFGCYPTDSRVEVERLNALPAPIEFRLLCRLSGCWPEGFNPCGDEQYRPMVESAVCH